MLLPLVKSLFHISQANYAKKLLITISLQAANKDKATKKGEKEALDQSEFIAFYYSLLRRPELDDIFIKYICKKRKDGDDRPNEDGTDMMMTAEVLADFLSTEQKVDMTTEECQEFINAFEPRAMKSTLSLEGKNQDCYWGCLLAKKITCFA